MFEGGVGGVGRVVTEKKWERGEGGKYTDVKLEFNK